MSRFRKISFALISFFIASTSAYTLDYTWTGGGADDLWSTDANWDLAGFPDDVTDTATINETAINGIPQIDNNYTINAITAADGTDIDVSGGPWNLIVSGDVTLGTGSLSASIRIVINAASTLSSDRTLEDLLVGAAVVLGTDLALNGDLQISAGSLTTGAHSLAVGGTCTVGATLVASGQTAAEATTLTGDLTVTGTFTAGAGDINAGSDVVFTGGTFTAGTGTFNFTGGNVQSVTAAGQSFNAIHAGKTGGSLTFSDALTASAVTTAAAAYDVAFNGATTTVTADANFLNTGTVTFGDDGDSLTFTGGLSTTAVTGGTNLFGTVSTTDTQMDLGAVTLDGNSTVVAGTGAINMASATDGAGSFSLDLQNGAATGTVTFTGNVTINDLNTFSSGYSVVFQGASNTIDTDTDFLNTGGLTLGNGGDSLTFDGGLSTTAVTGGTTVNGDIITSNDQIDFGAVTLGGASVIDSAGAIINITSVTGAGNTLGLDGGATGAITVSGAVDNILLLTVTDSASMTFAGTVGAGTSGAVTLTNTAGTVSFQNNTDITTLTTTGQGYNLSFTGTATSISNTAVFNNTGTLTLGNAGDTLTFPGGLDSSGGPVGTISVGGTINANGGNDIILESDDTITVTAPMSVNGAGTVSLSAADGISLTAAESDISTVGRTVTINADNDGNNTGDWTQSDAGSAVTSSGGAVSITAADIALTGTISSGAGDITLRPSTDARTIALNDATGSFSLDAAELTQLDSSGTVTVGRTTGTGTISVGSAGTLNLSGETYDLTLEGATSVTDFNFGGGNTLTLVNGGTLDLAAGGNVTASGVTDVTISGGTLQLSSAGSVTLVTQVADLGAGTTTGAVDLTNTDLSLDVTGAFSAGNNSITVNTGTGTFSNSTGTFSAGTQSVSITADDVNLYQTLTGTAGVTIQASTAARTIDIGTDLNLGLTDSDLDNISTNILTIGDALAGAVTVSAAVSPSSAATLHLVSDGGYTDGAGGTISVTNLAVSAGGDVVLDAGHSVLTVAISAPGQAITFTEADGFTVGTVAGVAGFDGSTVTITGVDGHVAVNDTAAANDINGTGAVSFILQGVNRRLTVDAGADIETAADGLIIEADRMTLNGSVTGTGQSVVLRPHTAGRLLDLGGADVIATTLGLTDAELDNVTAGVLTIGNAAMGAIDVSAAVSPAGTNTLHLISDEGFTDDAGITVANLAVDGDAAAVLDAGHDVDTLAFILTDNGAGFTFVDTDTLAVGSVDGVTGGVTNNGAISISTQDGSLTVNQAINAGTQTVQLEAGESVEGTTANLVLDANITGSSVALIAGDALNQTGGAISASSLGIEAETVTALTPPANLSTLAFNITGAGNFTFTDPDDFAVGTVGTVVGGTTADGNISLTATNGTITVSDNITAGGTGTVLLDANGGTSDISVGAVITSSSGIITLNADNDVGFGAAGSISSTSGNVSVTADADAAATGTSGAVTMNAASSVNAGSGTISLSADEGITLSLLQTTDNTGSAVSVVSGNGAIEEDGDAGIDIVANSVGAEVTLQADTGIGNGGTIETQAAAIDALNGTTGAIQLDEADGLIILQARNAGAGAITISTAGTTTVQAAGGGVVTGGTDAVSISVGGDASLTVNDAVASGGNTISLSADDDIIFGADGDVSSNGGVVTVTADNDNDNNGSGGALSMNDNTLVDAGNAAITFSADEDITLGSVVTTGVVVVGLTSKNGAVVDGGDSLVDVDAAAATLSIDAETGIGDGGAIDTMVDVLDAVNATSGALQVTETAAGGALQVYQAAQSSGGNAVNVQTVNGDLTVTAGQSGISVSGAATVTLTAGDNDASNDDDLIINDTVTAGSLQITLTSQSNDVRFGADGDVSTAGGEIEVNAGAAGAGLVTLANGTVLNAGAGLIDINGIGNVTLGRLVTSNNTASAVDVLSSAGQIIDGGNLGGADIAATWANAVVNLNAAGAIGVGDAIDTDIVTLTGSTTAAGNVEISETSDITIQSFTVSNGSFTLDAGGAVTATSVVLSSDAELNDISIASGGGGNITAGILTAGTGTLSDVSLNSAGIVTDAAGKITAQVLTADAAGAMTLDTTAVSIDAGASAVGNIIITETDAVTLTDIDTSNGDITVTAATGNINAGAVDDLDGGNTVTITADDGAINGVSHDATADISAATITLKADSGGIGTGTILDVNATVQLNADTTVDNGSILIEDVTGNLPIGTMTTGGAPGDITLWADNADQDVTDATGTVTCGVLTIRAGGDIGALTTFFPEAGFTPINTTASNLDLRSGIIAGAGSVIAVSDSASPGLTRVDASPAAAGTALIKAVVNLTGTATAGFEAADDIGLVSTGGAGTVTVPAGMDADDLRLDGNDLADSNGGDIDLDALNYLLKSGGAESFTITTAGGWIDAETTGALSVTNDGGAIVVDDNTTSGFGLLTTAAGDVVFNSSGDISLTTDGNISVNNGNLTILADSDDSNDDGSFIMAAGSSIDAGTGTIEIDTRDEITLTSLVSTNGTATAADIYSENGNIVFDSITTGAAGDITLVTDAGSVNETDDVGVDLSCNDLVITASAEIGSTATDLDIETDVDTMNISSTLAGDIVITEADGVTLSDVDTVNGNITITAGAVSVGDVDAPGRSITLTSSAAVNDAAADAVTDFSATTLIINAASGIGNTAILETEVDTLDIDNGAGANDIVIDETDAVIIIDAEQSTGGAIDISTANGTITVNGAINASGAGNIVLTAGGLNNDLDINSNIDGGTGQISLSPADIIYLGGDVTTTGSDIDFNAPTIVTDDTAYSVSTGGLSAGNITFTSTLDGDDANFNDSLVLTAGTGNIDFQGAAGVANDIGDVDIVSAADVTTAAAGFRSDTFLQQAGSGTTTLNGAMIINDAGVGAGTALDITAVNILVNDTITTLNDGPATFTVATLLDVAPGADMNLAGAFLQDGAGNVQTAGNIITSNDAVDFTGTVRLTDSESVVINSAGGDITFADTLDATTDFDEDLQLTAAGGSIDFQGAAGVANDLGDVDIVSAADVTTAAAGFRSDTFLQQAGSGTTTLNGAMIINDAGVGAGTALDITAVNILVNDTITTLNDGPATFTVATLLDVAPGADMNLAGAFLQDGAGNVQTAGNIITSNDAVDFTGTVRLTDSESVVINSAGGDITFADTLDATTDFDEDLQLTAAGGSIDFQGAAGVANDLGDVDIVSAADVTTAAAGFRSDTFLQQAGSGTTTLNGAMIINDAGVGAGTALDITAVNILVNDTITTLNDGPATFTVATLLDVAPGADMNLAGAFLQDGAGNVQTAGNIITSNDAVDFTGTVRLTDSESVVINSAGGDITFADTLDATTDFDEDLQLTAAGGSIDFQGAAGVANDIGDVDIVSAADVTTAAAGFRSDTFLQQAGSGTTTLNGAMIINDAGVGAGTALDITAVNILVNDTITTLNDGPATFTVATLLDVAPGADMNLAGAFLQDGAGNVQTAGNIITSNDAVDFTGTVRLTDSESVVINSAGGDITFADTLDATTDFDEDLQLTAAGGSIDFQGAAGVANDLGDVDIVSAADVTTAAAGFRSDTFLQQAGSGTTTLNGAMIINDAGVGAGTALDITAVNILVNDTITTLNDGPATFTVATLLDVAPGADMNLAGAFLQDGAGNVQTAGNIITSNDAVDFTGTVRLTDSESVVINSAGGDITFADTLDATTDFDEDLQLTAAGGSIDFQGAAGVANDLGDVDIVSAADVTTAAAGFRSDTFLQQAGSGTTTLNGAMIINDAGVGAGTALDITAVNILVNDTITTLNDGPATFTVATLLDVAPGADMNLAGAFLQDGAGNVQTAGNIITSNDAVDFTGTVRLTDSESVVINSAGGDITFADTLDATTDFDEDLQLTAAGGSIDFQGAAGVANDLGDVDIVSAADVTTAAAGFRSDTFLQQAGSGTTTLNGAMIINDAGVGAGTALDITAVNILVNDTITTLNDGPATFTVATLLDVAPGADMNLAGPFSQAGAGETELAGDIITSSDDIDFIGTLCIDGGLTISTTGGMALTFPVDIHIYAPGGTITLPVDSLTCDNLVLYAGTLDMGGNDLRTNEDLVLLGGIGGPTTYDDDDPTGAADVFAYDNPQRNSIEPALYNPLGPVDFLADYNVNLIGTTPSGTAFAEADYDGTVDDLTDSTVTVDGNFYTNGCSLLASGAWWLQVRKNDDASSAFAEAYNMTVQNCTVEENPLDDTGVLIDDSGDIAAVENVTVLPADAHWQTSRTARVAAGVYTVYDNVIRVEFDTPIENSNGEISSVIGEIYLDAGNTLPFTDVYSDMECQNTLTSADGDVSVFYIRIAGTTWNTDALSDDPGDGNSTDRHDVHQATLPQIHFVKSTGTADPNRSYILVDQYKNRIESVALSGAGDITDHCRPVLLEVAAGIEAHDSPPSGAMTEADAHNYFDLRYSEPVNIGTVSTLASGSDTAHNRSSDVLTLSGWDINGAGTVRLDSFFDYTGTMSAFSWDASSTNSIYRDATFLGGNTHGVRIYIAGYSTAGAAPDFYWPGYIITATDPDLQSALAFSDPDVTDTATASNQVEKADDDYDLVEDKGDPAIAGNWDVDPPGFAPYSGTSREIVSLADAITGKINRLEFHILDDYTADSGGWDPVGNPAIHPDLTHGVRDSSLNDVDAFYIEEDSVEPRTNAYNIDFVTDVNNTLFLTQTGQDDPYFAMNISTAGHDWNLLSELVVEYNSSLGRITDLAGNLLPSQATPIFCIERVPPYISLSLGVVGGTKVYVKFSEPVFGYDGSNTSALTIGHFNSSVGNGTILTGMDVISYGDNGGVLEAFLYLNEPLSENVSLSGTLKSNVDSISDLLKNAMISTRLHRVTDVAAGVVEPVWASDGVHADSDTGSTTTSALRAFDGTGKLMDRDITIEASVLASGYSGLPVQLFYDANPSEDVVNDNGLWLPSFVSIELPTPNEAARGLSSVRSAGAVRDFIIPASDPEMAAGNDIEFVLKLGNLFSMRSLDVNDPRLLSPWIIPIEDIVRQSSGVTILNNVINPTLGDKTVITYDLKQQGMVTINIFNLSGDLIKILYRGAQGTGSYTYTWDGTNRAGNQVARGIYFIRVVAPGIDEFRKVMVVK